MQIAFGRVRRKTEPTGPRAAAVIFLKLTPMVRVSNRTGSATESIKLAILLKTKSPWCGAIQSVFGFLSALSGIEALLFIRIGVTNPSYKNDL